MKKILLFVAMAFIFLAVNTQLGSAKIPSTPHMQQAQHEAKTFTGTVMKNGDSFVLSDAANKTSYGLDDAQKASQYEGKKVKVTGTVDTASNMIHVESIQEVA